MNVNFRVNDVVDGEAVLIGYAAGEGGRWEKHTWLERFGRCSCQYLDAYTLEPLVHNKPDDMPQARAVSAISATRAEAPITSPVPSTTTTFAPSTDALPDLLRDGLVALDVEPPFRVELLAHAAARGAATELGLRVPRLRFMRHGKLAGLAHATSWTVYINVDIEPERAHATAAHEVYHLKFQDRRSEAEAQAYGYAFARRWRSE